MICPQCGYDMGTRSKCVRCGYTVKTLVAVDEQKRDDDHDTKVIDPDRVYLSNASDYDDGFADPFSMLFGDIFDPIGDLLGGLFGFDVHSQYSSSAHIGRERDDEQDENVVEVKKVEVLDENGNPIEHESRVKKVVNKVKEKFRPGERREHKQAASSEQRENKTTDREHRVHRNVHGNHGSHPGKH